MCPQRLHHRVQRQKEAMATEEAEAAMDESAAVEARAKVAMVEVDVPKDEDTPELRAAAFEAVFREFSLAPKMLRFAQHVGSMVEDREEEERRAMMVGWKEGTDVENIIATIAEAPAGQKAAVEGSGRIKGGEKVEGATEGAAAWNVQGARKTYRVYAPERYWPSN